MRTNRGAGLRAGETRCRRHEGLRHSPYFDGDVLRVKSLGQEWV